MVQDLPQAFYSNGKCDPDHAYFFKQIILRVIYLPVHITEHEIEQEALALPESSSHRQHHHVFVSDLRGQENLRQRLGVQSKRVVLLTHCDNLNWSWFTSHP